MPTHFRSVNRNYLDGELLTDIKHEYIHGEVYTMAETKTTHNHIVSNINSAFHMHLKGKSCSSMMSDMKVKIDDCCS